MYLQIKIVGCSHYLLSNIKSSRSFLVMYFSFSLSLLFKAKVGKILKQVQDDRVSRRKWRHGTKVIFHALALIYNSGTRCKERRKVP